MRTIIVSALAVMLAGCGLPPAVTALSFVIDGFSLAASGKTTGELALSEVTDMDCALWRVLKGDAVCREESDGTLMAADVEATPANERTASVAPAPSTAHDDAVAAQLAAILQPAVGAFEPSGGSATPDSAAASDALSLTAPVPGAPDAANMLRGAEGLIFDMLIGSA